MSFQPSPVTKQDVPDLIQSVIYPSLRPHPLFALFFPPYLSHHSIQRWMTEHLSNRILEDRSLLRRWTDDETGENIAFISCQIVQLSDEAMEWRQVWKAMSLKRDGVTRFDVKDVLDQNVAEEARGVFERCREAVVGERRDVLALLGEGMGFCVRPGFGGRGLANRMVEWMTLQADEKGWGCYAMVPEGLRGTFERWGFVVGREGVWRGEGFVCLLREARRVGREEEEEGGGGEVASRVVEDYDPFGLLADVEISADECPLPVDEESEELRRDAGFYR